jgi:hypothetical protein
MDFLIPTVALNLHDHRQLHRCQRLMCVQRTSALEQLLGGVRVS